VTTQIEILTAAVLFWLVGCDLRPWWASCFWSVLLRPLTWLACWVPWPWCFVRRTEMVELVSIVSTGGRDMKQLLQLPPWLYMIGFILFQVSGSLLLRVASQRTGWPAFGWFSFGNIVGSAA